MHEIKLLLFATYRKLGSGLAILSSDHSINATNGVGNAENDLRGALHASAWIFQDVADTTHKEQQTH